MEQNPKQIQVRFRLTDIQQLQFVPLTTEWPEGEMQIGNQLQFSSQTDKRVIHCTATFEFKKNDITQVMLTVRTSFEFEREGWSAMYQLQGDRWVVPAGLVQHLADVTIGAARGILAIRSEEAGLPKLMLPLLNPSQMIRDNLALPRQVAAEETPTGPVTEA